LNRGEEPGVGFPLLLAALGVAARFLLADNLYFRMVQVPSHDMVQGLAFFTTSMHSLWLTGDLAWWNPASITGYAQYYQGLFSPLAPTYGHIVFIAWAHGVALLASLGVHLPEYWQYLIVNLLVMPFLAFAAFGWFCAQVVRRRESLALAMAAYVLSGIGLWNGAWFFFQEPFSLFLFLGTTLALLRRPTAPRLLAWLAAILIQLASINYWTVYNLFFVAIVLGSYAATHANQVRRLVARVRRMTASTPRHAALAAIVFIAVAVAWGTLVVLAMQDQAGRQVRAIYTAEDAVSRIQEMRTFTTELFNPTLERALKGYPILNAIHNARYVGAMLLPLVLLALFGEWSRRTRWLLASAVLVLAVCMGSPYAIEAWSAIPFMDRILHLFYFYTAYWQLLVVLLAAVGFDVLLEDRSARARHVLRVLVGLGLAGAIGVLAWSALVAERYPTGDPNLQSNLRAAVLVGLACFLLTPWALGKAARQRRFAACLFVLVAFLDLSQYFYAATRADQAFSRTRGWVGTVIDAPTRERLDAPWPAPDVARGFPAGLRDAMPVHNAFWPTNIYMYAGGLSNETMPSWWDYIYGGAAPFVFYDAAEPERMARVPNLAPTKIAEVEERLRVDDPRGRAASSASRRIREGFSFSWQRWRYNDFALDVVAPRDGWLMVRQLYDPGWRVEVDGAPVGAARANYLSMAFPLAAGRHRIEAQYRPAARGLYWWAAAALEFAVAGFAAFALRRKPGTR
jgi:hypothetical protein